MDRKSSARGFTLAELLIVVAIIAVLVTIAIPVFNSQLEKSREATDLANVRSAYAEVMTAAITEDKTATYNGKVIYDSADGIYKVVVSPLAQKQEGWTTPLPITIGGVSSDDADHWHGVPQPGGSCTIWYGPDNAVTINWGDGSGGSDSTPTTPGGESAYDSFDNSSTSWPSGEFVGERGKIYKYNGKLYVCVYAQKFDAGGTPETWYQAQFCELSSTAKVYTDADLEDHWGKMELNNPTSGQLYNKDGKYYIYTNAGGFSYPAPPGDHWVEINYTAK